MIFGTPNRPFPKLPNSRWIHVPGTDKTQGHWIPEEGVMTKQLILKLMKESILPQSIFVISPFRAVVKGLKAELEGIHKRLRISTIHTTQGKEADVVILVLGGDPEKPGAKRWASQDPNLLNVAASRARRRFYIVGNEAVWSQYPYFRDASTLYSQTSDGL